MSVIELGDFSPSSEQVWSREFDRRLLRNIALIVVAVLTVLSVTGSTRPQSRLIRTLWSIPFRNGDMYLLGAGMVYARTASTGTRLVAYDLTDGRPRWSMALSEQSGWPTTAEAAHVLLLPGKVDTTAFDSRTGTELWRLPGTVGSVSDDAVLLVDQDQDGTQVRGLRLVKLRDGRILWSRPTLGQPALGRVDLTTGGPDPTDPGYLAAVQPDGRTQVIRWADGVPLAAGRIEWRPGDGFDGTFSSLSADGRNLYVRLADGGGSSLTAYALDTLLPSWRQDGAARVAAYPCGPVICSMENDNVAAYDIVTGATRWRAVGVLQATPIRGGRILLAEGAADAYVLVDQLTGARIADLGEGTPVADSQGRTFYLLRRTRQPVGRTAISRVDPVTGAVTLRGTISTFPDYGCAFTADRAVCPSPAGRLVVTAVG